MEKMPFHAYLTETRPTTIRVESTPSQIVTSDWREQVPMLAGTMVTLRELEITDASALLAMLTTDEVSRFISPPPTTVEGFERFIGWAQRQRQAGEYLCFAVVPHGMSTAVGIFQIRRLDRGFSTAEWGFALGSAYWGTGMFVDAAKEVVDFAFETLGVHRLEARSAVANGRGNGALRKIGAVPEGLLRGSFLRNGEYLDQMLWSILGSDRWQSKAARSQKIQVH
jgi:RimJ/RimL family protein N-acetyltransferase